MILGWEGCETTRATFAFATLPTRFEALTLDKPYALETTSNPFTVRPVRVPTDVMFGCAGWTTELAVATVPVIELGWMSVIPAPSPTNVPAPTVPVTVKFVSVPTDVIFGWEAFVTDPAVFAKLTVPVRLATCTLPVMLMSVPAVVMLPAN